MEYGCHVRDAFRIYGQRPVLLRTRDDLLFPSWDRPGRRGDGAAFTVATVTRYFLHYPVHHRWDVARHAS